MKPSSLRTLWCCCPSATLQIQNWRIQKGKGVCGTAWKKNKSIIVDDVDKFEGHIACSSLSKSEIVIPLRNKEKVIGVLDVDHDKYKFFDSTDKKYLKKIINKLEQTLD